MLEHDERKRAPGGGGGSESSPSVLHFAALTTPGECRLQNGLTSEVGA